MLTLRGGLATGPVGLVVLLVALAASMGLSALGWAVGIGCGAVVYAAIVRCALRAGVSVLGPADVVTVTRAALACTAAALTADALVRAPAVAVLVLVASVALGLDAVDGWIARRTRTASPFGAKLDGEVDAFLILVLSAYVAGSLTSWVLVIGAARYVFAAAGRAAPWMRAELPFRYWRKVVTAVQGIVLTVAVADVLPRLVAETLLLVALALLAESFGRDVWWLWRRRAEHRPQPAAQVRRPVLGAALDALAVVTVWMALVVPNQAHLLTPVAFLRVPVEGLAVVALALVLPTRARRLVSLVAGALLGLLMLVKVLDMGFFAALDRPFNPVTDSGYLGPAIDLVEDALGSPVAVVALVVAAGIVLAVLVGMPLAVRRLTSVAARHHQWSLRAVTALVVVWALCAATGLQNGQGATIASASAGRLVVGQVHAINTGLQNLERFEEASAQDRYRRPPSKRVVLAGLRGKDVLVIFLESYGRAAVEGSRSSSKVRAVLDASSRRLAAAGYSSRSAWLTSPTFGGLSWLAHSTLQTGLWVDNQPRYEQLFTGRRMTLSRAFSDAGWRSVAVMPALEQGWAEGEVFYQFDELYGTDELDYAGPAFGWSRVPDQFVLARFGEEELTPRDRAPVFAKIDLTSSHAPWAPLPRLVPWDRLGDGSVYRRIHRRGQSAKSFLDRRAVREAYARSIVYCLRSTVSFVRRYGDDDLVVVLLGDHQPATVVTGPGASHDVPVTILARDHAVIDAIERWSWDSAMRPDATAPVWPMDAFRDRFLDAYSPWLPVRSEPAAVTEQR